MVHSPMTYLVLIDGVALFLVLQRRTEFRLALIHSCHKVVTIKET